MEETRNTTTLQEISIVPFRTPYVKVTIRKEVTCIPYGRMIFGATTGRGAAKGRPYLHGRIFKAFLE